MRAATLLLVLGTLCLAAEPASPSSVIVPDQYPTVQGAIDSRAAFQLEPDTVFVRDGDYPEAIVCHGRDIPVHRRLVLLMLPALDGHTGRTAMPRLSSFRAAGDVACTIRGFHFRGTVSFATTGSLADFHLESCRVDSGLTIGELVGPGYANGLAYISGCQIWSGVRFLHPAQFEFIGNTVIGDGVSGSYSGSGIVNENYIAGPAEAGIGVLEPGCSSACLQIEHNTVAGTTEGIVTYDATVLDNTVVGCASNAFHLYGGRASFVRNRAVRCGGHGFLIEGSAQFNGNEVDSLGGDGIFMDGPVTVAADSNTIRNVGGRGIAGLAVVSASLRANRILGVTGDAVDIVGQQSPTPGPTVAAIGNVIGHNGGRGVAISGSGIGATLQSNTVYACQGAGLVVDGILSDTARVDHNIFAGNRGYGFEWSGTGPLALDCNDWFGNTAGAVSVASPGPADLQVDPLFCRVDADSVRLMNDSPLLNALGCGLIGALGEGCVDPATGTLTPGGPQAPAEHFSLALLPPVPNPARRGARIAYTLPSEMAVRVKVLDVAGRIVAELADGTQAAGRHEVVWGGPATAARAGVYFVRLEAGGQRFLRRTIITP